MTELTKQDEQAISLLKQQALSVIQSLAGDNWSDHNNSDPGITILEVLATAIQGLSKRLSLPIEDLLTHDPKHVEVSKNFQLPQHLLPSNAVTLNDYRRLIIDINGVKGADVRRRTLVQDGQTIKTGLYDVIIDFNDSIEQGDSEKVANRKQTIISEIRQRYLNQRNVNEDIASIKTVKKFPVTLALSLSLTTSADPLTTVVNILNRIKKTISPDITRYQYSELLDQGLSGDEIFQGPLLSQGFILDKDLALSSMPESLYSSDISSALEGISGLKALKGFKFVSNDDTNQDLLWRLSIPEHHLASLNFLETYQNFSIEIDGHDYKLPDMTAQDLQQLIDLPVTTIGNGMPQVLDDYVSGQYHELSTYSSLQHQMPKIYALAEQRLDAGPINQETANILQLKAYLTLFDQVLADQFSQLDLLKELLSTPNQCLFSRLANIFRKMLASETLTSKDIATFCADINQLPMTKSSQPLTNISGIKRLLGDAYNEYRQQGFQTTSEPVFSEGQLDRLKRSCEHLFARFSETPLDASLLKYKEVFKHYLPSFKQAGMTSQSMSEEGLINKLVNLKQIVDLVLLLNNYPMLSNLRTGGFNYLKPNPKEKSCSGLVKRITAFLGIEKPAQLPLATKNQEGIYLLEGELLRFGLDSNANNAYLASQIFFIAPDWPTRFHNPEFVALLERQIVKDSPVHQKPHIVYLNREDMSLFERLYFAWLNAMTQLPLPSGELGEALPDLDQKDQENLALIESLCELLRQFLAEPQKITNLILENLGAAKLYNVLMLWLKNDQEVNALKNDNIEELQSSFYSILYKRFEGEENRKELTNELFQQIIFTICQAHLDALTKPNPIKKAIVGQNFRVGYRPLNFLKPAYPLPNSMINPDVELDESSGLSIQQILLEQPVFTLGIKQPHRI